MEKYMKAPPVAPEVMQRLAVIVEVLAGTTSVSDGARALDLSRNHFQSLLHRGLTGLLEGITPQAPGRRARPEAVANLEEELRKLKRENAKLQAQAVSTEELVKLTSKLLKERMPARPRRRKTGESPGEEGSDSEPEPRTRLLAEVDAMCRQGVRPPFAAACVGLHVATLRRWRHRAERHEPLTCALRVRAPVVAAALQAEACATVRKLHGLVGAESLRRSIPGLSRRVAARIKAATLTEMEHERRHHLTKVTVTAPGILRGMDAMHLPCSDGPLYALFAADGAVPFRTGVTSGPRYDADLVARALIADIERHGAPLVYRLDRASAHDAPKVRAVLADHEVLVLHGPPRYPRFYGQLERQNREHRAWLERFDMLWRDDIGPCLAEMLEAVNGLWRRCTLGWRTAREAWEARPPLTIDRRALREEVEERIARLTRGVQGRGKPADWVERIAIEQTLTQHGLLRLQPGGWC